MATILKVSDFWHGTSDSLKKDFFTYCTTFWLHCHKRAKSCIVSVSGNLYSNSFCKILLQQFLMYYSTSDPHLFASNAQNHPRLFLYQGIKLSKFLFRKKSQLCIPVLSTWRSFCQLGETKDRILYWIISYMCMYYIYIIYIYIYIYILHLE